MFPTLLFPKKAVLVCGCFGGLFFLVGWFGVCLVLVLFF